MLCDQDKAWLLERKPDCSQDELEKFSFKVADLVCDLSLTEQAAREASFKVYFGEVDG